MKLSNTREEAMQEHAQVCSCDVEKHWDCPIYIRILAELIIEDIGITK